MIDIETRRIVDILESRDSQVVAAWLKTYPNIEVVSRDGSMQYAAAIKQAHPKALQVSDRFHIIKNLTEYAKSHITKIISANIRIPTTTQESHYAGVYWEKPGFDSADLPEKLYAATTKKKEAVVDKVRELAAKGFSIKEIAAEAGITPPTVKRYMDSSFAPMNPQYHTKRASPLKPYTGIIDDMLNKRNTFREIESAIKEAGYSGAASTIRMYATRQRRIVKTVNADAVSGTEVIERKWITKLLYQPPEKVKGITPAQVECVIKEYPIVGKLYDLIRSFKEIMFANQVQKLEDWLKSASALAIDEINSFINGIMSDLDAVKNSIRFEYNNGLAEGKVNKLKLIKRVMFGRCSFHLFRNKVFLLEYS
jgi:predicted transcriptional regulator